MLNSLIKSIKFVARQLAQKVVRTAVRVVTILGGIVIFITTGILLTILISASWMGDAVYSVTMGAIALIETAVQKAWGFIKKIFHVKKDDSMNASVNVITNDDSNVALDLADQANRGTLVSDASSLYERYQWLRDIIWSRQTDPELFERGVIEPFSGGAFLFTQEEVDSVIANPSKYVPANENQNSLHYAFYVPTSSLILIIRNEIEEDKSRGNAYVVMLEDGKNMRALVPECSPQCATAYLWLAIDLLRDTLALNGNSQNSTNNSLVAVA